MNELGLAPYDAHVIVAEREIADFFELTLTHLKAFQDKAPQATQASAAKLAANWLTGDFFAALNRSSLHISESPVSPAHLAQLVDLILTDVISGRIAKDVFLDMWDTGTPPAHIVESKGLQQITDTGALETSIEAILAQNADKVAEYRSGKDKLFGFFVGQVMKATGGKANPAALNEILLKKLSS